VECIKLFKEMQQGNLEPTASTFTSILTGCSHSGLVEEGLHYFRVMQDTYLISPSIEHYNCVVDLLGRANRLDEAEKFILEQMSTPNIVTWRTLLSACRTHNDVGRAKRVVEQIVQLDPYDASSHVVMANLHAAGNEHTAAQNIRANMLHKGIKKIPGTTTTEANGVMHTFHVNNTKHRETKAIYTEIEMMRAEAQAAGYMPDLCFVLHDVEEEVKKDLLWYHSEKIASLCHATCSSPLANCDSQKFASMW
jgi:pentatricopeptide repeat protein